MAEDLHDLLSDEQFQARLLQKLYNRARCPGGRAMLAFDPDHEMSLLEALSMVRTMTVRDGRPAFDYVKGRVLKVDFNRAHGALYDRDNGPGSFEACVLDAMTDPTPFPGGTPCG